MSCSSTDVVMPQMGVSVTEGTVVAWHKQPGDLVRADEPLLDITTDKIDVEIPSPVGGTLAEILVAVDETVEVGTVLARVAAVPAAAPARRRYSPVVKRIATVHGIDLTAIHGTGRDGRVRKQDVLALVGSNGDGAVAAPEPPMHIESPYRPEPEPEPAQGETLSRMRRAIGAHMKRSQQEAATCTSWIEVDMSRIEAARRATQTTALPHVARCAVGALRELPQLNAWLEGDRHTVHDAAVHLGIAVSLGEDGLIVPVVRDAHELSAEGLAARIGDLARRARAGTLEPGETRGATFTITNPGQHGTLMATPIINQPQVAILDVEAVVRRPVVVTDAGGADAIAIRPVCVLGMSWDHRALDGVLAARFLAAVRRRAEGYEG